MKKFLRYNGLSLVMLILFLISMTGQALTGHKDYNQERSDKGLYELSFDEYLSSGHFISATFENWESEFFQMGLFVILTVFLFQKGSSESKDPDGKEEVDRKPDPKRKDAPGPVKKGGWRLKLYSHSLSLSLLFIFLLSFLLHWYGSLKHENEERGINGLPPYNAWDHVQSSTFWFESFQNWQSEFLSILVIVIFSVYLREFGSSQSKPVDAPHGETGE